MKQESAYAFRETLCTVHEANRRNRSLTALETEFVLPEAPVIALRGGTALMETAMLDFMEFLQVSMNMTATVGAWEQAHIRIALAEPEGVDLLDAAGYKGFRVETTAQGITLYGHDERGAAQGLYYLEDVMSFRCAPFVPLGTVGKKPMYAPRMLHSGYGVDAYPDHYLRRIAHEGYDVLLVFTKGTNLTPAGPMDFNDLIARAGKYGLDVYAYSYIPSKYHPEDPEADAYYESTYGELFRQCPGLRGVVMVGESVRFPSHDPRLAVKDGNPHRYFRAQVPQSASFPCCDYPQLVCKIRDTVRKYVPDADVIFWTYNFGWAPKEDRLALLDALPTDISLQATFETHELLPNGGRVGDYTLSFVGPGKYFASEAEFAAKKGLRLYTMSNTCGRTWDFGTAPYEPMPFQWIRRLDALRKAHEDWGLCGIMEGHHYGWYPSFITKLAKWSFWEQKEDSEELLRRILIGEYGQENLPAVWEALELMSEAINYYIPSDADQRGAFCVGPAHPFCLTAPNPVPSDPKAHFGNRIHNPRYNDGSDPRGYHLLQARIGGEIASLETMLSLMEKAVARLETVEGRNEKLDQLLNLSRYLTRTVLTGLQAKRWYVLKTDFYAEKDMHKAGQLLDAMEALLLEEKENARRTLELVDRDSTLGWEPSMLYIGGRDNLEWKMEQVQFMIDIWITEYRAMLKKTLEDREPAGTAKKC